MNQNSQDIKKFHKRNLHNKNYDFNKLAKDSPALKSHLYINQYNNQSVNFSDPNAIIVLNQALLKHHYNVSFWNFPLGNLCPGVPGRVDYIHYLADLLANLNNGSIPTGKIIRGLDIGTGAGCIYPLLGNKSYGWKFVGTDISTDSIEHSNNIIEKNPGLKKVIKLRLQNTKSYIFKNIIGENERFDFTICNPPFYSSFQEAKKASFLKIKNLNANKQNDLSSEKIVSSNFKGKKAELWCKGGELQFLTNMINESFLFKKNCRLFTTLVSNKKNLDILKAKIQTYNSSFIKVIPMVHGKKITHILAWSFS